jgi:hypothetical protein
MAFILRFWLETREFKDAEPIWRGIIEHIPSGQYYYFNQLDHLHEILNSYLNNPQSGQI